MIEARSLKHRGLRRSHVSGALSAASAINERNDCRHGNARGPCFGRCLDIRGAEENLTKAPAIAVRREASSWNLRQLSFRRGTPHCPRL
jgi:hypothetical protein